MGRSAGLVTLLRLLPRTSRRLKCAGDRASSWAGVAHIVFCAEGVAECDNDGMTGRTGRRDGREVLVLLTGAYPADYGDAPFVRREIEELARSFDTVHVYSFQPLQGTPLPLPPNVEYKGNLSGVPRRFGLTSLLLTSGLRQAISAWKKERRAGRTNGKVPRVLGNIFTGLRFARAIESNLEPSDVVSVYSFWGTNSAMALPFLPVQHRKTVRLHGFDLYEERNDNLPLRTSIFQAVNNVAVISEHGRGYLKERYADVLDSRKLKLSRLGTADYGLGPEPAPGSPLTVVSCSSVIPLKRVASLIPALQQIALKQQVRWVHFGAGELFDELADACEQAMDASPNLSIELRGQVRNDDIVAFYQDTPVDVFANVSDVEGVPVSVMEAMSFGIPVVATDAGGTGEIVGRDLGSGILLPLQPDNEELVAAMKEVAEGRPGFSPRLVWERMSDARNSAATITSLVRLQGSGRTVPDEGGGNRQDAGQRDRLLIISFSDISNDARVLKQVTEFSRDFEVTTCGYGLAPPGSAHHIQVPDSCVHWKFDRADVILHRYRHAYWSNSAVDFAAGALGGKSFDIILANDLEPVPLAVSLNPRLGVHADLHEYAPREKEHLLRWRLFVAPFRRWLCRTYLPQCASVTTVAEGIAKEYEREFGVQVGVVMNATPPQDLKPGPVSDPIRLVHSGACLRGRDLGLMAEAVVQARMPLTLDMYLTPNDPNYLAELREQFAGEPRIHINDPVPYEELVATLNKYDVGVFVLPPTTFSYRWALPNKLFDFVQARLGVIVSPSPEMARIVREFQLGAVTGGFDVYSLVRTLDRLTPAHVRLWKQNSDAAAKELSSTEQVAVWRRYIYAMGGRGNE